MRVSNVCLSFGKPMIHRHCAIFQYKLGIHLPQERYERYSSKIWNFYSIIMLLEGLCQVYGARWQTTQNSKLCEILVLEKDFALQKWIFSSHTQKNILLWLSPGNSKTKKFTLKLDKYNYHQYNSIEKRSLIENREYVCRVYFSFDFFKIGGKQVSCCERNKPVSKLSQVSQCNNSKIHWFQSWPKVKQVRFSQIMKTQA